nr:DNA replication helicase [Proteomonas sp. NIES-1005]
MSTLPYNLELERALLAKLILNPETTASILEQVSSNVFYVEEHKHLYTIIKNLNLQGQEVSYASVSSILDTKLGQPAPVNLIDLLNSTDLNLTTDALLTSLTELYFKRQIVQVGIEISLLGKDPHQPLDQLFNQAQDALDSIMKERPAIELATASDVLLEAFADLELRSTSGNLSGLSTGFSDLDLVTQGFQRSDLIIIAGRPSMGKTSFALNLARNIADLHSEAVAIFSLEMSSQQIVYRFLSIESQITTSRLRTGNLNSSEWVAIKRAVNALAQLNIYIDDTFTPSIGAIGQRLQALNYKTKSIGLVIIDYLQLLGSDISNLTRVQELSKITRELKRLARDLATPVVVLSQLSRGVELRPNKRPILADLRESGCVPGYLPLYHRETNQEISLQELGKYFKRAISVVSPMVKSAHVLLDDILFKRVFYTGRKTVATLTTVQHLSIEMTGDHKFWTSQGWTELHKATLYTLAAVTDMYNFRRLWKSSLPKRLGPDQDVGFIALLGITPFVESLLPVYDIWVPHSNSFVSNFYLLHNSIEQDADLVLMLYRDSYYNDSSLDENNITEVIISKHRNGPTGTVYTLFDPNLSSFNSVFL